MTKKDEFGSFLDVGGDSALGEELLSALEEQDGEKTAIILRELMYLCGWDVSHYLKFNANVRLLLEDSQLCWWTAVGDEYLHR